MFEYHLLLDLALCGEEFAVSMHDSFFEITIESRPIRIFDSPSSFFSVFSEISFIDFAALVEGSLTVHLVIFPLPIVDLFSISIIENALSMALFFSKFSDVVCAISVDHFPIVIGSAILPHSVVVFSIGPSRLALACELASFETSFENCPIFQSFDPRAILAAVVPAAIKAISTLSCDYATSISFPVNKLSNVPSSVGLDEPAFSVLLIVFPHAFIYLPIGLLEETFSVALPELKHSVVARPISFNIETSSVLLSVLVLSIIFRAIRSSEKSFSIFLVVLPGSNIFRVVRFMQRAMAVSLVVHEATNVSGSVSISESPVAMLSIILPLAIILTSFLEKESASTVHFIISPLANIAVAIWEDHSAMTLAQLAFHLPFIYTTIFVGFLTFSVRSHSSSSLDTRAIDFMSPLARFRPVDRTGWRDDFRVLEIHELFFNNIFSLPRCKKITKQDSPYKNIKTLHFEKF